MRWPLPEAAQRGNDIVTQDLLDLQAWMMSLVSPAPGRFDEVAAGEEFKLFHGRSGCGSCHQTAEFTGPGLRGISRTAPCFHDHSAPTLEDAVARFAERGGAVPLLTPVEQAGLVEYLSSL